MLVFCGQFSTGWVLLSRVHGPATLTCHRETLVWTRGWSHLQTVVSRTGLASSLEEGQPCRCSGQ